MKAITFKKFDEMGNFKAQNTSAKRYTVRGAIEHLQANGFFPMTNTRKLAKCWTNGKGINAYII